MVEKPFPESQSLLAYPVLHRNPPHTHDQHVMLFWGDFPSCPSRRALATIPWRIHCLLAGNKRTA